MKQKRFLGLFCLGVFAAAVVSASGSRLQGQNLEASFNLPERNAFVGSAANLELTLSSNQAVQGIVAAADWDDTVAVGSNLTPATSAGQALASADLIQPRIESSYFVLGVIMDTDGSGGEIIPPGNNILLATVSLTGVPSGENRSSPVVFQDGLYGTVDMGPKLDNIIAVGGFSIGEAEGLDLNDGRVNVLPPPPGIFTIQDTSAAPGGTSQAVNVLMDVNQDVEGYVVAITHNPTVVSLTSITIAGTAAQTNGADFNNIKLFNTPGAPTGGTLGVVMDLVPPFDGNVIPPGTGLVIGRFTYSVVDAPQTVDCEAEPPVVEPPVVADLTFSDFALGDPPLENIIVVAGFSRNPELRNGKVTFPPPPCPVRVLQAFACGSMQLVDDDNDPTTPMVPGPVVGPKGSNIQVFYWYRSPPTGPVDENNDPGSEAADPADLDDIQGLSMAVCYGPGLDCLGTYTLEGTITQAIGAEFVNVHCSNEKRELVIGILVDALPPFDGKTFPPTIDYLKVIGVDFNVTDQAVCGEPSDLIFCRGGATGGGEVLVKNQISVMNMAFTPQLNDCKVMVVGTPTFVRGDCNNDVVDGMENMAVNIADAASVVSALFQTGSWKFKPPCNDSCDANDDGRLDLADSVTILRYLFIPGNQNAIPRSDRPGCMSAGPTNRGEDCTGDKLDCVGGTSCPVVIP
jgi:hypothetical protein